MEGDVFVGSEFIQSWVTEEATN